MIKKLFLSDSTTEFDLSEIRITNINGVDVNGSVLEGALFNEATNLIREVKEETPDADEEIKEYKENALKDARYLFALISIIKGETTDIEYAEKKAISDVKRAYKV